MQPLRIGSLALLILSAPLPIMGAEPWTITDWDVDCYRPTCAEWYGSQSQCASGEGISEWSGYDQEVLRNVEYNRGVSWKGQEECSDTGGPRTARVRELLRQASEWLQPLGFNAPRLLKSADGTKYRAFVAPPYVAVSVLGTQPPNDIPRPFYVPLDSDTGEGILIILEPDPKHIAHELFHAVQHNSPAWTGGNGTVPAWIEEGTAEAVGLTFAQRDPRANRTFDEILNWNATPEQGYEDQLFWRRVGDQLNSQSTIQYLSDVLDSTLSGERGVGGVDGALKRSGEGLVDEVPEFFSDLHFWDGYFEPISRIQMTMPPGRREYEKDFSGRVKAVAGTAHDLRINANPQNLGKPLEIEIRYKSDHPDLHLIVDGHRYDNGATGPRNLYRDLLVQGSSKDLEIVTANVASEAARTQLKSYDLHVTLREVDWCSMTARVTGDVGGAYFGDVAHFSTRGGATIYGAFSNPEMIAGVADWLGGMAEQAGGEEAGEQIREQAKEFAAGADEIPRETFGLSLSEQKLDAEAEQALGVLAGGFTLEASVIGPDVGEGVTGSIPLKMLRVVPGPRAESTLDKVPFVWVEGAPGSAQLFITRNTGDLVAGRISGTLYAEGYYKKDRSIPVIVMQASFVALEGPTGCMGIDSLF